ncbi:MAG: hypothetical protein ACOCXH_15240 [Cyclobacteriaceae bacterium]
MKTKLGILLFASLVLVFNGCKKNNDGEEFAEITVEESKAEVEDAGIKMVETMDDMSEVQTIDVSISLGEKLGNSDPLAVAGSKSKVLTTIEAIAALKDPKNLEGTFDKLKAGPVLPDNPETIKEIWDAVVGVYSWNDVTGVWDYSAEGDKILFKFPASEEAPSNNNAELSIYNYAGVKVSNPVDEDYTGDLPTDLNMDLKVDGSILMTYVYAVAYDDQGVPTSIATDLTIEGFKWEVDVTNNDSEISANYKFTYNDETIMDIGGGMKGNFTEEAVDNNTYYETDEYCWTDYQYNDVTDSYDEVEVCETEQYEIVEVEEIINSANAHFQLFDIAIKGDVNVKKLGDELREIYDTDDYEIQDSLAAVAVNKYLNLRLLDGSNKIIAKVEAYSVTEVEEWGTEEYTYTYIDFRFKFGDGSKVDAETYFGDGFDSFMAEVNNMINELNKEYDLMLDPVEY